MLCALPVLLLGVDNKSGRLSHTETNPLESKAVLQMGL